MGFLKDETEISMHSLTSFKVLSLLGYDCVLHTCPSGPCLPLEGCLVAIIPLHLSSVLVAGQVGILLACKLTLYHTSVIK